VRIKSWVKEKRPRTACFKMESSAKREWRKGPYKEAPGGITGERKMG